MAGAVIVATARSPIGTAGEGSLRGVRSDELAAAVVRAALAKVPELDPSELDDLVLGCEPHGNEAGSNLARVVAVMLGHYELPGTTITRYCASSLQAIRMATQAIKAGEGEVFVSAGVEASGGYGTVSDPSDPSGPVSGRARTAPPSRPGGPRPDGGLPARFVAMGRAAETVARLRGISRAEQDEFAVRSQNLAEKAIRSGFYAREIIPITLPDGTVVDTDDAPCLGVTLDYLSRLRPVIRPDGTVTAGNSHPLGDGAAAVVVASDRKARERGITPLARIVATSVTALPTEIIGLGPVEASRQALERAGMTVGDVDLVEIDEEFAAQIIPSYRDLGVDLDRLNVHGGAIALGHPVGGTGARITTTLLNGLVARDKTVGLATMYADGGQGMAMVIERLN